MSEQISTTCVAIVHQSNRPYRKIAQENWGLSDEQMIGMHVHHRTPVSLGGSNDPTNLYVCSPWFHKHIWHGPDSILPDGSLLILHAGNRKGTKDKPETIERKRQSALRRPKQKPHTFEARQKMSEAQKGKRLGNTNAKGNSYTLTEEQKENRRRAAFNRLEVTCPVCGRKCKGNAGLSRHITKHF